MIQILTMLILKYLIIVRLFNESKHLIDLDVNTQSQRNSS